MKLQSCALMAVFVFPALFGPAAAQPSPAAGRSNKSMGGTASKAASRTPASGHPNRQAAAGSQQQRPKQQQHAPRQQHAQAPPQEQQVLAGLEAEDPAPFMAELTAREQQYGPNHPAVAESCSNLAILFNQKGDYNAALPLYERALAIYEANYGPNHQEVAHTLTDLAVLHLEQVRHTCAGQPSIAQHKDWMVLEAAGLLGLPDALLCTVPASAVVLRTSLRCAQQCFALQFVCRACMCSIMALTLAQSLGRSFTC